jgi:AcrR family transcriptional regulator
VPEDVKGGRPYDASGRQAAARQTRRSILEAAIVLFTQQGYGSTTMQEIADEAGVAVQTIYATLKNKPRILAEALDIAIAGDDSPVAVNDRNWMAEVWTAETGEFRLRAYAQAVGQIMTRAGEMFAVVTSAALNDARVVELDRTTQHRRRLGATSVVNAVIEVSPLATGLTPERAIDIVWVLNSPAVHQQLVRTAGWSIEEYAAWLGNALTRELLG